MKKVLQFSGIISALLGIVAFILMMATNAVVVKSGSLQVVTAGTVAIFGETNKTILGEVVTKPSPLALIGWILLLVGLVLTLCGIVLPLLKVKGVQKFAGLMNLVAVACFVVAGVFMFLVVPSFVSANGGEVNEYYHIGAGWVIGGILAIAAGVFAILPAAADFLAKKK